jgi:hypothetical protein
MKWKRNSQMAKFYVQSGTLRIVIQADDARKAALWAVHKAMQQILPLYDDDSLTASQKRQSALRCGHDVLGDEISLSELGFESAENAKFDMFDVVTEWNQLMVALARIEESMMTAV